MSDSTFPRKTYLLFHALVLVSMLVLAGFNVINGDPLLLAASIVIIACLAVSLVLLHKVNVAASLNFLMVFAVLPPTVLLIMSAHRPESPVPVDVFIVPHLMTMVILAGLFLSNTRLVWLVIIYGFVGAGVHEILNAIEGDLQPISLASIGVFMSLSAAGALGLSKARNRILSERDRADASSKAKSDFLARMSHEIRTPLSGARGLIRVAKTASSEAERDQLLTQLETSLHHMGAIVDDILDFEKMEAVGLSLDEHPVMLPQIAQDVVELFAPVAAEKGVSLTADTVEDCATRVLADPRRLRQVLYNLTHNALKFTSNGSVTVRCRPDESSAPRGFFRVVFSVSDTGEGMTKDALASLFEPFQSTQPLKKTNAETGTGLGLEISRRLVDLMGAELRVESTPGRGTTFSFAPTFPLAPAAAGTTSTENKLAQNDAGVKLPALRVLVAEDDVINLMVANRLLEAAGCVCYLCEDGEQAVETYKREVPEVVLMDNQMPRVNGEEAIRRIRREEATTGASPATIVALTAYVDTVGAEALQEAGADEIMLKPLTIENLKGCLSRHLTRSVSL